MKKTLLRILSVGVILCLLCASTAAFALTMQSEMITISIGQNVDMIASPAGSYTWKSSSANVASVTSSGRISGQRTGYSVVTATGGGETAYVGVKVISGKTVTGVSVSQSTLKMYIGVSKKLKAMVAPKDAADRSGKWVSSNKKVATVTSAGVVKGVGIGTCTVYAVASSGVTAACEVTVLEKPVTGIKLSAKSGKLLIGNTITLKATVAPADAKDSTLTWYSLDDSIATVSYDGKVTAVSAGKTKIVAQSVFSPNVKAVYTVTVTPIKVSSVKIVPKALTLEPGAKLVLASSVLPANATNGNLIWKSSKPGVVYVENGLITAAAKGKATISATSADGSKKKAVCTITVQ